MGIESFPLGWRWTQPSHAVFPPEVLASLKPMHAEEAETLYARGEAVFRNEYASARTHQASDHDAARAWLSTLPFPKRAQVSVLWDRSTGIKLPWQIFVTYWDDFCYPSSDDLFLFAEESSLALAWNHYEVFEFRENAV